MIVALDIGGTAIKTGLFDEASQLIRFEEFAHDGKQGGQVLVQKVCDIIARFEAYEAICISTSGQVDHETGTIVFANDNIPYYTGTKLKAIVESQFHVPVFVENDVNCAALGEMYFGAATGYRDFLCVTYGTGVGGAIIMQQQLYKGASGIAAEFGHMITHMDGLPCNCGRRGCYESYASTTALIATAKRVDATYHNGVKVLQLYKNKDAQIIQIVDNWISEVVTGLATLIHIFNPPAIVLGGGIMEQGVLIDSIQQKLRTVIMDSFSNVDIVQAQLGNKAGLYGALSLYKKIK